MGIRNQIRYITLTTAFMLSMCGISFAQLDARSLMRANQNNGNSSMQGLINQGNTQGGINPAYADEINAENTAQQNEQADTTKKERKKRPLESYFFNDSIRALRNFGWHIRRNTNHVDIFPIDTTLALWRIDYPHQHNKVGNSSVGGLGQASIEADYFDRTTSRDFTFSQPYDAYTYNMENTPFYNMKHPFIWMTYLESGQKRYREEHFEIKASQNINPSTSVGLNYRSRGSKGKYDRSRIKNQNFAGTFARTGRRYTIHAGYLHNTIEQQENGGVVGEWAIADTVFEMPSGVPMKLAGAEAKNKYENNSFFVEQSIGIPLGRMTERDFSMADLSAVYIGHTFEYNEWSKVYSDKYAKYTNERGERNPDGSYKSTTGTYYDHWYLNPTETRDSTYERVITNRLFVQVQPWDRNGVVGTIDGGVGIDIHTYSQFALDDYLTGRQGKVNKTSWFAYAGAQGKVRKYVDWGADFKLYPSGYRAGDYSIGARASFTAFINRKPFTLSGSFSESGTSPGYWMENWHSNHFMWTKNFSKEGETRFNVAFTVPDYGIELGFGQSILRNKIYYGADCLPAQHDGAVSVTSIYARKDFSIKGLHLNHRVLVQFTSDRTVVPLPIASAFLSYYYEFWIKRDVLRAQVGIDGHFNTSYYAPGYNPALSVFYNQNEVQVGNYPYLDAFISAKWKRMRILIKYQHWNYDLFGNGEMFQIATYPLNPGMFKIGISWSFYD